MTDPSFSKQLGQTIGKVISDALKETEAELRDMRRRVDHLEMRLKLTEDNARAVYGEHLRSIEPRR